MEDKNKDRINYFALSRVVSLHLNKRMYCRAIVYYEQKGNV